VASDNEDQAMRIVDRATTGIASIISRYREGELDFGSMVGGIEVRMNSMIGFIDPEWLEEWRSHWNRLEYVNASMIDEDRDEMADDEREMVDDAIDSLKSMATRYPDSDALEPGVT